MVGVEDGNTGWSLCEWFFCGLFFSSPSRTGLYGFSEVRILSVSKNPMMFDVRSIKLIQMY